MNPALAPMIVEIGVISYRTMSGKRMNVVKDLTGNFSSYPSTGPKRPPLPSELIAVFAVFGAYAIIGEGESLNRRRISSLLGWGTVIATFLSMYSRTGQSSEGVVPTGPPGARNPLPKGVQGPVWTIPPGTPRS